MCITISPENQSLIVVDNSLNLYLNKVVRNTIQFDMELVQTVNTAKETWNQVLGIIKKDINYQSFKTWFEPIVPISLVGSEITVRVPSKFFYEWIESHFYTIVKKSIQEVLGPDAVLQYRIDKPADDTFEETVIQEKQITNTPSIKFTPSIPERRSSDIDIPSNLNPKFTFENFIKGDSNQLARAASFAVSDNPGNTTFNPLVIYGGVGLGKTHLIQAIGNRALGLGKSKRVMYVSSEKFTIEFVNAIQHNKVSEFSSFYRNIDLLIVDDIQFFSGKEKTQEEFFHVFNTLHQSGKQIVLSSDRAPKDLKGLEERLISRFQWGLTTDIQPPDLETRIAILNFKAQAEGIYIPSEVNEFIAANVTSNVRQLEGCLNRVIAQSTLTGMEINLSMAKDTLKDMINPTKNTVSINSIHKAVCEYLSIPYDMLIDKSRGQEIARARQIAMYLAKEYTHSSLKSIGLHFGGRDHTTVIHAIKSVKDQIDTSGKFKKTVNDICKKIDMSMN